MKRFLPLTLALLMAAALAFPAFATAPPADPDPDEGILPLVCLFDDAARSRNGEWTSSEFAATASNGNYIRYRHQNDTSERVKVYLFRTDESATAFVSMMYVEANDQNSKVYYSPTAGSGTYRIVIEAYVSGGAVNGDVSAAQYKTNPDR